LFKSRLFEVDVTKTLDLQACCGRQLRILGGPMHVRAPIGQPGALCHLCSILRSFATVAVS